MKISYGITVCNELEEIKELIPLLLKNKNQDDEIVIIYDEKNGNEKVLNYLLPFNKLPNVQTWRKFDWNNNFGEWKNILNDYCSGDYIFQIDADEIVSKELIINLKDIILLNPEVELFFLPRINIVDGITQEHIKKWRWVQDETGRINFPDFQGRIYKKGLKWEGNVHEKIVGAKFYSFLPLEEIYCLKHHKKIERQQKQNDFYNQL